MSRKIYTEVVIDMNPESSGYGDTLHEDSYMDDGPIALCGSYYIYDDEGNEYSAVYKMGGSNEAYHILYYRNGVLMHTSDLEGLAANEKVSDIKKIVNNMSANKVETADDWSHDRGSTTAGEDYYTTKDEAYMDYKDFDPADLTFDSLYGMQGVTEEWGGTSGGSGVGTTMDLSKSFVQGTYDLTDDQMQLVDWVSKDPLDQINKDFQTDVKTYSDALRDTNVSFGTEIGGIQSGGGFAGESGALIQPIEYQQDLAQSSATTAYGALSSSRFGDITEDKERQMTIFEQSIINAKKA